MTDRPRLQPAAGATPKAAGRRAAAARASWRCRACTSGCCRAPTPAVIDAHMRELDGFDKCDRAHFDALLHGCIAEAAALDAVLARHVDRRPAELSPVEHAVLMIGAYELTHCLDMPYRVVINEAVELAKSFGGTDGHKYVNGVLDKCAADLRPDEWPPPALNGRGPPT
jgi:N utilization substance protein B